MGWPAARGELICLEDPEKDRRIETRVCLPQNVHFHTNNLLVKSQVNLKSTHREIMAGRGNRVPGCQD